MKRRYLQTVFILCVALLNAVTGYAARLLTQPVSSGSAPGFLPGGGPTEVYQTDTSVFFDMSTSDGYVDSLEIPLVGGLVVTARKLRVDEFLDGKFVWSGQIPSDVISDISDVSDISAVSDSKFSEVFLTTAKGGIVGYVQYDHRFFVLDQLP